MTNLVRRGVPTLPGPRMATAVAGGGRRSWRQDRLPARATPPRRKFCAFSCNIRTGLGTQWESISPARRVDMAAQRPWNPAKMTGWYDPGQLVQTASLGDIPQRRQEHRDGGHSLLPIDELP